jgi:signal transduction histidine kinase
MKARFRSTIVNISFVAACGAAFLWFIFSPSNYFSNEGYMPHGHCYLWQPALVWTMVITNLLIGLAYVSIALCLYVLVRRIKLPFSAMFLAFGAFIFACGGTHFVEIYTLWFPNYWLSAFVNVITAIASVATAILIFPLFPKVVEFVASARLSEERKKQLELMNAELERTTTELRTANKELEAFSYSVAHDLRSPLRGINGFSAALLEDYNDKLGAEGKEYLNYIQSGSRKMGHIIDDLLNLSKISRKDVTPKESDLTGFAKESLASLQLKDPHRNVSIFIQEGISAWADPGLMRLVIENLLSNAWKFTSKAVGARIEFGAKIQDNKTIYFVRDNGIGFEMNHAEKLFSPFQRLHSADEYEGTGIGLATVRRILNRHSGDIWAESETGKGTTFYFYVGK